MKTARIARPIAMAACILAIGQVDAQTSVLGNSPTFPGTDYLGWDGGATVPLMVRHNGNYPIEWYTDSIQRMQLWHSQNSTINGFGGIKQNGYLGISNQPLFFDNGTGPGPFSRLHLADSLNNTLFNYAQPLGFRPWMRNGVTFTGNADQGYVGQKFGGNDSTDMVIQWSDNPGTGNYTPDRLRFIFTGNYTGTATGARSWEGLEAMRLFPVDHTEVNVGIGDFYGGNVLDPPNVTEPTERLDILNGRVRIRQLPSDPQSTSLEAVVVNMTTGVLEHRPFPATTGGADCDWSTHAPTNRIWTAFANIGSTVDCPEKDWKMGVGTNNPTYKLEVVHTELDADAPGALRLNFRTRDAASTTYGIFNEVLPAETFVNNGVASYNKIGSPGTSGGTGVTGQVVHDRTGAAVNTATGVAGLVNVTQGSMGTCYGVKGEALLSAGTTTSNSYGLYGSSGGASTTTNSWGIYARSTGNTLANGYGGSFLSETAGSNTMTANFGVNGLATTGGSATATDSYGGRMVSIVKDNASVTTGYGVRATSENQGSGVFTKSYGVYGYGRGGTTHNYGVYGLAGTGGSTGNYSVFGQSPGSGANDWAGFFTGPISVNGLTIGCDEQLKTDIQDLEDPTALLMQLQPKSYTYRHEEYPQMALPQGVRYGFISQEVQEVFPQLTTPVHQPEQRDSLGNIEFPAVDYLGLSPLDIIPLAVGALQEQQRSMVEQNEALAIQQATIEDLLERMTDLEQALAACCSAPDGTQHLQWDEGSGADPANERKLVIQPNPFSEGTTVSYTLERGGRMQLLVNSSDGKQLRVLEEAVREAGAYRYDWHTAGLAPGVYYVTLLLDGEPVVKKAVKVQR